MSVTWSQHCAHLGFAMFLLFVFDRVIVKPLTSRGLSVKDATSSRWFFIHAFANALVVITALRSMAGVLGDPLHAMDGTVHADKGPFGSGSVWPLTIINAVHIYHLVGGFRLSAAERFHHMLFIPTLGFPGQLLDWGALGNWQAFFISGLPGMIDYSLLGLQKLGRCRGLTEKRVNANLNVWCRAPGIGSSTWMLYQAMLYGHHNVPLWAAAIQLVLPPYNALYYGKQAVANYAVHFMLDILGQDELIQQRISERTSVTTGTQIMSWKDALGVPQRGS
jgi:hypothetical protein